MKPLSPKFHALALAAGILLAAAAPAHAVGRLMDVNVIDRDSGARLPVYRHDGQWWVAGRPGARYAIEVRNDTNGRLLGVMSVDGVNILSGETASWDQSGYVLSRGETYSITGWRKSNEEVAAFNFTALPNSYAARTGRPDNVGVIGVAVFREKPQRVAALSPNRMASKPPPPSPSPAAATPASPSDMSSMSEQLARSADTARAAAEQPAAQRLGTGHGARESSRVTDTQFTRLNTQPDEIIAIRYDSCENLVALGVTAACPGSRPRPFPESGGSRGFVPDPPRD